MMASSRLGTHPCACVCQRVQPLIAAEQGLESLVSGIDKSHFRPMQKEAFLCQARCCDSSADQGALQAWCAAPGNCLSQDSDFFGGPWITSERPCGSSCSSRSQ